MNNQLIVTNIYLKVFIFIISALMIDLIVIYSIRKMVYHAGFRGMSKTKIKKILKDKNWKQKITLYFILDCNNSISTKVRLFTYYLFITISFFVIIGIIFREYYTSTYKITYALGEIWFLFSSIIVMINSFEQRK